MSRPLQHSTPAPGITWCPMKRGPIGFSRCFELETQHGCEARCSAWRKQNDHFTPDFIAKQHGIEVDAVGNPPTELVMAKALKAEDIESQVHQPKRRIGVISRLSKYGVRCEPLNAHATTHEPQPGTAVLSQRSANLIILLSTQGLRRKPPMTIGNAARFQHITLKAMAFWFRRHEWLFSVTSETQEKIVAEREINLTEGWLTMCEDETRAAIVSAIDNERRVLADERARESAQRQAAELALPAPESTPALHPKPRERPRPIPGAVR